MDGIFGACFHTDTAADTFRMIWCLQDIDIHLAYFYTLLTSDTLVFFYLNAEKRYLIKQGVDCAKRADPFTEGSVKKNAQNNHGDQYHAFERKQLPSARGMAPSRTPCGQIYLQKNGSPIPMEFVTSTGSRITKIIRIIYLRYLKGLSFAVENFFPGILWSIS